MHEMAITQGIIKLCLDHAGGRRVRSLDIEIGELGTVVPEAIEFCFDACTRETLLEGAYLNIIRIPGMGRCHDCLHDMPLTELYGTCAVCGSHHLTILAGEELRVREIEVED